MLDHRLNFLLTKRRKNVYWRKMLFIDSVVSCRGVRFQDVEKRKKFGGKRHEARSRGSSSPDTLAFEHAKRPDDRADYCLNV